VISQHRFHSIRRVLHTRRVRIVEIGTRAAVGRGRGRGRQAGSAAGELSRGALRQHRSNEAGILERIDMTTDTALPSHTAADRAWFAERVEALLPELYGVALRLCGNRADAEDLVADAIARAWQALSSLEDRSALRAWLFRILNNRFISERRSARAKADHESLDATPEPEFSLFERLHQPILLWWGNPELAFLNRLLRADLERAIEALPGAFRDVVVLVDVQGLSYGEVAELLDIPIGTVRSRLARGRSRLQVALWEHARDAGLTATPPSHEQNEADDEH
jgi:RNA polymerase sigma-70 factor, ECF subfamily